jgi:flavin reductase (DIM6/NTAB) family NADH-FMN oxidoreductase RutF
MGEPERKAALRMISYGVYVLGAEHEGQIEASTVTWVTQSSFDPPQVAVGLKKSGRPLELVRASRRFVLNFLESGQKDLAYAFFKPSGISADRISGYRYSPGPILDDAPAWIEAQVVSIDESGDHAVVIGRVTGAGSRRKAEPLTLKDLGLTYGG